ncbi:1,4-beta-xylanase, partial [Mycobacterium sp. ITM-2017-0098]
MDRRTALKLPAVLAAGMALSTVPRASAGLARWSPDRAHRWHRAQGWLVGVNFIPANAINQLEMFQPGTFDPRR